MNSQERGICFDFLRGQCNRGLLCRFSHDLSGIVAQQSEVRPCIWLGAATHELQVLVLSRPDGVLCVLLGIWPDTPTHWVRMCPSSAWHGPGLSGLFNAGSTLPPTGCGTLI